MSPILFIDTWGWIALANRQEPAHEQAKRFYDWYVKSHSPIVTTDYILDELITFLFARIPATLAVKFLEKLLASIQAGFIRLEYIHATRFDKAWRLRLKYKDKPDISFTDFTSFAVMLELQIKSVLSNDRHFQIAGLGFTLIP